MPCGRHAAHERDQFGACQERRQLHRLPFAASRQRIEFLAGRSLSPSFATPATWRQKAEFDMPFHHRVNEGLIQCTDCHNPHGTVRPQQVRTSSTQDAVCFTCHTDKQGPFVFEHQPVKDRRLPVLPFGARRAESAHAETEQREPALPAMPHASPASAARRERLRSTTRRAFSSLACCATRKFTARTSIRRSLNEQAATVLLRSVEDGRKPIQTVIRRLRISEGEKKP